MKRMTKLLMAVALAVPTACTTGSPNQPGGDDDLPDPAEEELNNRVFDYNAALRIAALRLTGDLPTLAEIEEIGNAADLATQKSLYEARVTEYLERPTFGRQMFAFFQNMFRMGGDPMMDSPAALGAMLAVNNDSYMKLLTNPSGNCPTYDGTTFTVAECPSTTNPQAGVLGNQYYLQQYYSNLGFRRVKATQELFDCSRFPVDPAEVPRVLPDGKVYTGKNTFELLATTPAGRVDFQDSSSVVCANCHGGINFIAPVFAQADDQGIQQPNIVVKVPLDNSPTAKFEDYLAAGTPLSWRNGVAISDIPSLGAAMSQDPSVALCAITRFWDFAMNKQDPVEGYDVVLAETVKDQLTAFTQNGFKLKDMIKNIFLSEDFTKF